MSRIFNACKETVSNRGIAPNAFLNKLIDWCLRAPDEIFQKNENHDIYSQVFNELGAMG